VVAGSLFTARRIFKLRHYPPLDQLEPHNRTAITPDTADRSYPEASMVGYRTCIGEPFNPRCGGQAIAWQVGVGGHSVDVINRYMRQHQTIRCSPAMAAGVSRHLWALEELVDRVPA
jgi:hypothetical protein